MFCNVWAMGNVNKKEKRYRYSLEELEEEEVMGIE